MPGLKFNIFNYLSPGTILILLFVLGVVYLYFTTNIPGDPNWTADHLGLAQSFIDVANFMAESRHKSQDPALAPLNLAGNVNATCENCGKSGGLQCSACNVTRYCSKHCQKKDWDFGHKDSCQSLKPESPERTETEETPRKRSKSSLPDFASSGLGPPTSVEGERNLPKKLLFPYEKFLEYNQWDVDVEPPTGLVNPSNNCFANSVLQSLTYIRPLAGFLMDGSHSLNCSKQSLCIMCELEKHFKRSLREEFDENGERLAIPPFSASRVLRTVRQSQKWLGLDEQEDVHEFLRFTIDAMQGVLLEPFGGESEVDYAAQATTLMYHVFGGVTRSYVQCTMCGHQSASFENVIDLTLAVGGDVNSLEEALEQYTKTEWMDGENKYNCEKCQAYVRAGKRLQILEAPNILTVAFKRFQAGYFGKINKAVSFPDTLDLSEYMSEPVPEGDDVNYSLYAVIIHFDLRNSSFFGHYVCCIKGKSGKWYLCDDAQVHEVDEESVFKQKAYLLLYRRNVPKPAPACAPTGATEEAPAPVAEVSPTKPPSSPAPTGVNEPANEFRNVEHVPSPSAAANGHCQVVPSCSTNGVATSGGEGSNESRSSRDEYYGPEPGPFAATPEINRSPPLNQVPGVKRRRSPEVEEDEKPSTSAGKLTTASYSSSDEDCKPDPHVKGLLKTDPKKRDGKSKPGRNKQCTCGSNKKWKKCCGRKL